MGKNEIDGDTPATTATIKLPAPSTYYEAKAFAHSWLETVKESDGKGWQVNFKVIWNSEGRFEFAVIEREFVGYNLERRLKEALETLQYDNPLDEDVRNTLLTLIWDKQETLHRRPGRPKGSPWAGTIWKIAFLFSTCGFALSRNETSPQTSGFDALADAMYDLGLQPNSYSGVADTYYKFAKSNGLS